MKKYKHFIDARGAIFNSTLKQRQLLRPLNNLKKKNRSFKALNNLAMTLVSNLLTRSYKACNINFRSLKHDLLIVPKPRTVYYTH